MSTSSPLFLPPEPNDAIGQLLKLAAPRDFIACPYDGAELDIHLHGGMSCPQCGSEFEMGYGGRVLPSDKTIEESAGSWPDTHPWGVVASPLMGKAFEALRSLQNGGFSLDAQLNPISDLHYVTSFSGAERTIPIGDVTVNDILSYRAEYADSLNAGAIFGGWLHGALAYLDLSKNFADLGEAMRFAQDNGQIGIWDEAHQFTIPVGIPATEENLPQSV